MSSSARWASTAKRRDVWDMLARRAMRGSYGWDESAKKYLALYEELIAPKPEKPAKAAEADERNPRASARPKPAEGEKKPAARKTAAKAKEAPAQEAEKKPARKRTTKPKAGEGEAEKTPARRTRAKKAEPEA